MTASLLARYRFARHLSARQVVRRLALQGKRRVLGRVARLLPALRRPDRGAVPRLKAELPQPLFPPRGGTAKTAGGGWEMTFLNRSHAFGSRVDWGYREVERGACLWQMNLHYMEYLECLPAEEALALMEDWAGANPPYGPGYWLAVWNSYTLSIRVVVWMQQLARHRTLLEAEPRSAVLRSLRQQLGFLAANLETDIGGNHLIKNIKALIWAGAFFEGAEAARLAATGRRLLAQEIETQVLPDGTHYERSPSYHAQVFADLLECYQVLEAGGLKERLGETLDRMAHALRLTTMPDGYPALFNDAGLTMAYAPADCLAVHERLREPLTEPGRAIALPDAGYFGWCEGGDYLLADCGPLAPDGLMAHAHADILSFVWCLGGQRMIVDAGVYEYRAGPRRAYARSTTAHNTLTLDDRDQCEFVGPFRVGRRAPGQRLGLEARAKGFVLEGEHAGYAHLKGAPIHRRRIALSASELHIADEVIGGAGQTAVARLLLHEDCRVFEADQGLIIERGTSRIILQSTGAVSVEEGWRYPDMGQEVPTKQVRIAYGPTPCQGHIRLIGEQLVPATPALEQPAP